jgi:hypothetical protein
MCPVSLFLSIALADGVFSDAGTFEDIKAHEKSPGTIFHTSKFKSGMRSKPAMRSTCPDGAIYENGILSYDAFNNALKGLSQRAGYEENVSAYCFRRAFARNIMSMS